MSLTKANKMITRLEIKLPSNKNEYIDIYSNTDPDKTAYNFSVKHNLSFNMHQDILNRLKTALNKSNIITTNSTNNNSSSNYLNCTNNIKIISTQIKRKRNISQSQSHHSILNINTQLLSKKKLAQSKSEPHSLKLTDIYDRGHLYA